ncbi:MAG: imidazole glycerol phosphate synthase subunit HisH [Prevotella sp.]|nr:imidazole glycerol phosphate synthase subunit HisH [Prevotella sp.]
MRIAIVKYNAGNIFSVTKAFKRLGIEPIVTDNPETLMSADRIVFPGQGEASTAMHYLKAHQLDEIIRNLTQPVLGICIGQQLLCAHTEEGDTDCIGIFPIEVKKFCPARHEDKVPAMGWNMLTRLSGPLFKGIDEESFAYFVHSYYVPLCEWTIAQSDYIQPFSAALNKANFYATQFHPEKSGAVGELIIKNFLEL